MDLQNLPQRTWPEEYPAEDRLEYNWTYRLRQEPEELWPRVIDTSQVNRKLSLPRMVFEREDGQQIGRSRVLGFKWEWREHPWEWSYRRWFANERQYEQGFGRVVRNEVGLIPEAEGTTLLVYFGWVPRSGISRLALRLLMSRLKTKYDELLADGHVHMGPSWSPEVGSLEELPEKLQRFRSRLGTVDKPDPQMDQLLFWLERADDQAVNHIQPYVLAERWGWDPDETLKLMLRAADVGLLRFQWELTCPHCRGVAEEVSNLSDLPEATQCEACREEFEADGLNSVEITFRPHESVRQVDPQKFCSAQPDQDRSIRTRLRVESGETRTVKAVLPPGEYTVVYPNQPERFGLTVEPEAGTSRCRIHPEDFTGPVRVQPDPELTLVNPFEQDYLVSIKDMDYDQLRLRPHDLFTCQEFRERFGDQELSVEMRLQVGRQALFLSDVVGSSRLYREEGDDEAFELIRNHFETIESIVKAHNGAVVKTMGDATLAAFDEDEDCLRAAARVQRRFRSDQEPLDLRMTAHAGPCLAVNMDTGIDYFGRTVNQLANLQGYAATGELLVTDSLWKSAGEILSTSNESDPTTEPLTNIEPASRRLILS